MRKISRYDASHCICKLISARLQQDETFHRDAEFRSEIRADRCSLNLSGYFYSADGKQGYRGHDDNARKVSSRESTVAHA